MENELGYINDLVEITTKVKGNKDVLETSAYTGVKYFFETHLSNCLRDQYNSYKLRIGDKIGINPSKWTIKFCDEKSVNLGNDYEFTYVISNIQIEYSLENPKSDTKTPLIEIQIELTKE